MTSDDGFPHIPSTEAKRSAQESTSTVPRSLRRGTAAFAEAAAADARSGDLAFHMPGHRGGRGASKRAVEILSAQTFALDRSEMGGLDYLHAPERELVEAQALAARTFGASQTWFLINGSSVGNHAALLSVVGDGDEVLVPRATHRSVHAALALADAVPLWVPSVYDDDRGGWLEPDIAAAYEIASARPKGRIRAVHLTRPTYYGVATPLEPWVDLARSLGAVLIVDEAHGSHLVLNDEWPAPALHLGADLVVQSTHKTLGALTQAAMLHVGPDASARVDFARVSRTLALLQSSSPSVLLTASLDLARAQVDADGASLGRRLHDLATTARIRLAALGINTWAPSPTQDPTKLVVDVRAGGRTGHDVAERLQREHHVVVELADLDRIVCSLTIADDETSLKTLVDSLGSVLGSVLGSGLGGVGGPAVVARHGHASRPDDNHASRPVPFPPVRRSLREALRITGAPVTRADALGRIATEFVIPYPPGIPLVVPGEELTGDVLDALDASVRAGCRIVGPSQSTSDGLPLVVP